MEALCLNGKTIVRIFFSWGAVGARVFCWFGHLREYCVLLRHLPLHVRACLHEGGGPQIGAVTCGGSPHVSCKRDQIKMRDYMDRRVTTPKWVTSPTWGPPPPCKQALRGTQATNIKQDKVSKENVVQLNSAATTKIENSKKQIKVYFGKTKQQRAKKKERLSSPVPFFPLLAQLHVCMRLYTLSLKCTYLP